MHPYCTSVSGCCVSCSRYPKKLPLHSRFRNALAASHSNLYCWQMVSSREFGQDAIYQINNIYIPKAAFTSQPTVHHNICKLRKFNSRHIAAQPISAPNLDATTSQSSELHLLCSLVPELTGHPKSIWVSFSGAHQILAIFPQGTADVDGFQGAVAAKILRRTRSVDVFLVSSDACQPVISSIVELKCVAKGNDEKNSDDGNK